MTLRAVCKRELGRIPKNLANGPASPGELKQYVDVFERHAKSETHAIRVIDALIERCEFFPKIAQIVETCGAIDGEHKLPPGCARCEGQLHVIVTKDGTDYAIRCSCERGQYLRARDRERAA